MYGVLKVQEKVPEEKALRRRIIPDSSMVEHTAVNRGVVGSSPTRGVFYNNNFFLRHEILLPAYNEIYMAP